MDIPSYPDSHAASPGAGSPSAPALTEAVSRALAVPDALLGKLGIDLGALHGELSQVAAQAHAAMCAGIPLAAAVHDPRFDALRQFHTDLRDSLLVEVPAELRSFVDAATQPGPGAATATALGATLADIARPPAPHPLSTDDACDTHADRSAADLTPVDASADWGSDPSRALAELLVFEAVRLRLLVNAWQSDEFERLGGREQDIDAIAGYEVQTLLAEPALFADEVRPLPLMVAAASVSLAADAADRADALRLVNEDVREELAMQARLKKALRELRLPESVLLGNALSGLLGEDRQDLVALQEARPVALEGMSRQAMDQRVSRGRKALTRPPESWPRRRGPALVDLFAPED